MGDSIGPTGGVVLRNAGGINIGNTGVIGTLVIGGAPPPTTGQLWMAPMPTGPVVERPELAQTLRSALTATDPALVALTTALEGAGGFGKTTMAAHLCRTDPEIRERFPGGLLWTTLGQHIAGAELADKINGLYELLVGAPSAVSDPELAGARLGAQLDQRPDTLFVIDDVWHAEQLKPFLLGGHRCRRLITTRNRAVLPHSAHAIPVEPMKHDEAVRTLTESLTDMPTRTVHRLVALTGRWPVLLGLANAAVLEYRRQGATVAEAGSWVLEQLAVDGPTALDLDDLRSRERAVAVSLQASLDLLDPDEQRRYFDLGVFPEDTDIPGSVLALLWQSTGSLDRRAAERLRVKLVSLRLATGSWQRGPALRLHDVFRGFLRHRLGESRLIELNRALLDGARTLLDPPAAGPNPRSAWWRLPPEADYVWRNLSYHLAEADSSAELTELVCDPRWLTARIERYGPVAADRDLSLAKGPIARGIRRAVGQAAHLLVPLDPSITDTLLSRLHGTVPGVHLAAAARETPRRLLTPYWRLPDRPDPLLHRTLEGHTGSVRACIFLLDGRLVSAGLDHTIRVWNTDSGSLDAVLHGRPGWAWGCAADPNGTILASAHDDGTVRLWNLPSGTERGVLVGHQGAVTGCAVAPDGT
ncbi:NB-ARC domain-containing protein, partial [Kitasatospora sp. NPDC058060]